MNLRIRTLLIILLILILSLLSGCSLLRGIIPSLPNKGAGPVHNLTKDSYYNTIQVALDDADSGNTIEVADGTYDESITFPFDKLIILQSINGPSSTTIRGNDGSDTLTFNSSLEGTTLEGFTITHADGLIGRGIYISGGYLIINNCTVSDNSATDVSDSGGGIYNIYGTLTIIESTISGNAASAYGGGICSGPGTLTIIESTISGNAGGNGGGIYSTGQGTLTITGNTISNNTSNTGGNGGGIYSTGQGTLTITGNTISNNSVYYSGGGIYLLNSFGTITIGGDSPTDKNTICGNYKCGYSPSLDQQIRGGDSGDLYETYKYTNYISAYCTEYNPPTIKITSPSDGETVSGTVRFSSYATDDHGLEKVEFYIDDELKVSHGPFGPNTVGSTCNWDCDTTPGSITYIPNGNHTFKAKAYDTAGQTCLDTVSFIVDNGIGPAPVYPGYAIIVAGEGGWREKWLINRSTNCAYRVLRGLNFSDDDIFYLNNETQDADDDGYNDVDGDPTRDNLKEAITEWATQRVGPSAPLILCMVGHGMEVGSFDLNELEQVLGFELEEWFGVLPKENEILIVIDACYSGSFITNPVNSISSKNRVIVTSCRADQKVRPYFNAFAKLFWEYLYLQQGYDVREAFIRASQWPEWGEPQLDDPSDIAAAMIIGIPSGPIIDLERLRWTTLCSPGELRVYDSEGRITGLVIGNIKEEIPDSIYIEESKTVIIWPAVETYCDEVVGTDAGTYELTVTSEYEETSVFTATDIPTSKNEIHQYTIDWEALSQGWDGVTVQIDFDGDGTLELTINTDSTFTFVPAVIDINPDTLSLKSKIKWVTAYIELPKYYDVANIDVSTVKLWYENNCVLVEWGNIQDNTLMVKFNGKAVQDLFAEPLDAATIALTGELRDGTQFGGDETILVI